jgi:hypothetical protein
MLNQTCGGHVEQHAGPLGAQPRSRVEPLHQPKVLRLLGEVTVAEVLADLRRVVPAGVTDLVRHQISR